MEKWTPVIGIEIHAQIQSKSKMFSSDSTHFHSTQNQCIHPVSLGFPGTLPYLNAEVIQSALKVGKAFNCEIQKKSVFSRKNYFYPDLPKGYQISQFNLPILTKGFVKFFHEEKPQKINMERIHIEEDAGKLIHCKEHSLVDFNRAGMPLLEIISKPEISSPTQAAQYARMVRSILLYLEVCDGNLQEGSMRFDCNISLRPSHESRLGTKVELKNLNSFRFIEKALEFEIKRQSALLDSGEKIKQETRLFNPKQGKTYPMREKEEASDYRYFPEPDLPPLMIDESKITQNIELPFHKIQKFHKQYQIPFRSSLILAEEKNLCAYFESTIKNTKYILIVANWIVNEILAKLNENKLLIDEIPISPHQLAEFCNQIGNKTLSSKMAKELFSKMWTTQKDVHTLMKELNLKKIDDESVLIPFVNQVIQENPKQWTQYREGKESVYQFFIGQIMKLSKGQADPIKVGILLKKKRD